MDLYGQVIEVVSRFFYLGDAVSAERGAELTAKAKLLQLGGSGGTLLAFLRTGMFH